MTDSYRPPNGNNRRWTPPRARPEASPNYHDLDVNRTPLHSRHSRISDATVPAQQPRIWDDNLDVLMHRTIRAYDLVVDYENASHGGTRWSREDIQRIGSIGARLHGDVRALKHWNDVIEKQGEQDRFTMGKLRDDIENLRNYCEQIQDVIKETERVPLAQRITRGDGVPTGQNVNEDHATNDHGSDGGKNISLVGGTPYTDSLLPPDPNKLDENAKEGYDVDTEMRVPSREDRTD
jgi:hypothetical protein